ncbi:MAG TPA: VOC family protein [Anaerolineae bacterium]|nr:VOC family protein [Anaerolineae bacterium]
MNHASNPTQPGAMNNRSMPPGTIIPELVYSDLDAAVAWLCKTLGFTERLRIANHRSQLVLGDASIIAVARSGERRPGAASLPLETEVTHSLMVRVPDVDRHYGHARRAGARTLHPPETYPYGERQYTLEDIGGHYWTFSQSVADVAPEEWGGRMMGSE